MTETLTLTLKDRARIERAVWTLDSYLRNLPRKSRIAKRRELRVNLRAASADVGRDYLFLDCGVLLHVLVVKRSNRRL